MLVLKQVLDNSNYKTTTLRIGEEVWSISDGIKSDYKGTAQFELLGGSDTAEARVTLSNAWPKKISHSRLTMSSNEFKLITVLFAYDWYRYEDLSKGGGGVAPALFPNRGGVSNLVQ